MASLHWLKSFFRPRMNALEQSLLSAFNNSLPANAQQVLQNQIQCLSKVTRDTKTGETYLSVVMDSLDYLFAPTAELTHGVDISFLYQSRRYVASIYFVGGMLYKIAYNPPIVFHSPENLTISQVLQREMSFEVGTEKKQITPFLQQWNLNAYVKKVSPLRLYRDPRWEEISDSVPDDYLQFLDMCDGAVLSFAVLYGRAEILDSQFDIDGTLYYALCQVSDLGVIAVNSVEKDKRVYYGAFDALTMEPLGESFFFCLIEIQNHLGR